MKETKAFEVAHANRSFEIEHFWKRALFFWGFIASAFAGYLTLRKIDSDLTMLISGIGLVCSIAWSLANRGSKYWQEYWEAKVETLESAVVDDLFIDSNSPEFSGFWGARKYSVTRLAMAVSDYVSFIWILIFVGDVIEIFSVGTIDWIAVGFAIATAIYLVVVFYGCRSRPDVTKRIQQGD